MNDSRRYKLHPDAMNTNSLMDYKLAPLEIAVFWFMRSYAAEHGRGVTLGETMDHVGREETQVRRAWRGLERAGLIEIEARLTAIGTAIKNAS